MAAWPPFSSAFAATSKTTPRPDVKRAGAGVPASWLSPGMGKAIASSYDEGTASALAGLLKLSECGALPGVYSSAAAGCGRSLVAGQPTACESAGIEVEHGLVRLVLSEDLTSFKDPVFGMVARFHFLAVPDEANNGRCLGIFRAASGGDDFAVLGGPDSLVPLDGPGQDKCAGCLVDRRSLQVWSAARRGFYRELEGLGCGSGSELLFAGRGLGGAVTTLAMFESALRGFKVRPSYIFGSRRPGNGEFETTFMQVLGPALFHVTYNRDIGARRPKVTSNLTYASVGIEVFYPSAKEGGKREVCVPGWSSKTCGIDRFPRDELTEDGACAFALAPDATFCNFPKFIDSCYLGLGYEFFQGLTQVQKEVSTNHVQPRADKSETSTSKEQVGGGGGGAQKRPTKSSGTLALLDGTAVTSLFNKDKARFLAAMNKMTFCGLTQGSADAVVSTCNKYGRPLGITCLPSMVQQLSLPDEKVQAAIFASIVGYRQRGSIFPQYLVAIRGTSFFTAQEQNAKRNHQVSLVPYFTEHCPGAMAHEGYANIWSQLKRPLLSALRDMGATPTSSVEVTGYSMGGALAQLAMFGLVVEGYLPKMTYLFEPARPLNEALAGCLTRALKRNVPFFRITNQRDSIPAWPPQPGYADMDYEVHFADGSLEGMRFCLPGSGPCGVQQYPAETLSSQKYHCVNPLAPEGNICSFGKSNVELFSSCYLGSGI